MDNLFKPFGLGEDHYDQNVGLSLMLTKHIMEVHNGKIEVENHSDGGARVKLIFNYTLVVIIGNLFDAEARYHITSTNNSNINHSSPITSPIVPLFK